MEDQKSNLFNKKYAFLSTSFNKFALKTEITGLTEDGSNEGWVQKGLLTEFQYQFWLRP